MKITKHFNKWMVIAIVLTVGYFFFLYFAAEGTVASRDCASSGVVANWFGCLTMNELGDFFAGAFAPVAFIWLVAAVLIQSQELRAQREELEQNREVMMAQAAEARKQAEYIGEQTELFKEEKRARDAEMAAQIFDASIGNLAMALRSNPFFASEQTENEMIGHRINSCIEKSTENHLMIRKVTALLSELNGYFEQSSSAVTMVNPNEFVVVLKAGNAAVVQYSKLPEIAKINADSSGLREFQIQLVAVATKAENLPNIGFSLDGLKEAPGYSEHIAQYWMRE